MLKTNDGFFNAFVRYLQPVLPDDPFLQHYFEEDWSDDDEDQASGMPQAHGQDDVRYVLYVMDGVCNLMCSWCLYI